MLHHCACAAHERVGNIWYLLPEYSQCRKAIWQAINPHTGKLRLDEAFPIEKKIQQCINIKFGLLPDDHLKEEIKQVDNTLLYTEGRDLMTGCTIYVKTEPMPN